MDKTELLRIRDAMLLRGPDGDGLWISDRRDVGLAHRRLAIIDLKPTSNQPMTDSTGRFKIVFNGEIYNYKALRALLETRGYVFRTNSDTEVLLNLYAADSEEMVRSLRGMYAFAIWDESKRGLLLARDPFGIKPLYFSDSGKSFRFASQVKALLHGGQTGNGVCAAGHVGFFLWGSVPEPFTLYSDIQSLEAGATLWVTASRGRQPAVLRNPASTFFAGSSSATKKPKEMEKVRLRDALRDSIKHHLIADVPVGLFLSSGRDSCTLAAVASECSDTPLKTVTLGFQEFRGTANDETVLSALVAKRYGTDHHTSWMTRRDFEEGLSCLIDRMDQPSIDGVNTYFVCRATADLGLKVVLSGVGGDELFGGYSSFTRIPRILAITRPFNRSPVLGRLIRKAGQNWLDDLLPPKFIGLLEYANSLPGAYMLARSLSPPWELNQILDPGLVAEGWNDLRSLQSLAATVDLADGAANQLSLLEMTWYMKNQLLRDADWASMAHSIELRVPLVDIKLLRTVMDINSYGKRCTKLDMASCPTLALPPAILKRKKTGFSIPVTSWMPDSQAGGANYKRARYTDWAKYVYTHFAGNSYLQ